MLKTCKECHQKKSLSCYHMSGKTKAGKSKRRSKCSECQQKHRAKNWSAQPEKLLKEYKRWAKARNLTFKLTLEQFLSFQNQSCNYCGELLDRIRLDRINNKVGYTINNVVPCCHICNKIKGANQQDIFIKQIEKIYLHQLEQK